MSPEKETKLFANILFLIKAVEAIQRTQQEHTALIAEVRGRLTDMPNARDFGRLKGRLAEMSQRLPTALGYAQPKPAA